MNSYLNLPFNRQKISGGLQIVVFVYICLGVDLYFDYIRYIFVQDKCEASFWRNMLFCDNVAYGECKTFRHANSPIHA